MGPADIPNTSLVLSIVSARKNKQKSEIRMTTSVLKQDNKMKGSKQRYVLGQKHNLQIFG